MSSITNYSDFIRVRRESCGGWHHVGNNIFVERLVDGAWCAEWSTDEVSNGNAYTEAAAKARALAKRHC